MFLDGTDGSEAPVTVECPQRRAHVGTVGRHHRDGHLLVLVIALADRSLQLFSG